MAVIAGIGIGTLGGFAVGWGMIAGLQGPGPVLLGASLVASGLAVALYVGLSTSQGSRDRETRCRNCGYILRGISEPRCPECGERI